MVFVPALATDPVDVGLAAVGNSGIMGLAFPRVAAIPLHFGQNLISNVLDTMDVNSRFFAVHLGRNSGNGTLTIGKCRLCSRLMLILICGCRRA
jgi:hypothetical protein